MIKNKTNLSDEKVVRLEFYHETYIWKKLNCPIKDIEEFINSEAKKESMDGDNILIYNENECIGIVNYPINKEYELKKI